MGQLTIGQDLQRAAARLLDEPLGDEGVRIHDGPRGKVRGQIPELHQRELHLASVGQEAPLGQASKEGHLSALEPRADPSARPGLEPLVSLAGRLPLAGPRSPADALALACRARRRTQVFEPHDSSTFRQKGTRLIMPRIVGVSSCSTTCLMWRSPSALTVASWVGDRPMRLLTSVSLSVFATGRLLPVVRGLAARRI